MDEFEGLFLIAGILAFFFFSAWADERTLKKHRAKEAVKEKKEVANKSVNNFNVTEEEESSSIIPTLVVGAIVADVIFSDPSPSIDFDIPSIDFDWD